MKILTKMHMNFDFHKLSKYINSKDFESKHAQAEGESAAKAYQQFIKKGKVKPSLATATKAARKARKTNPSIGGTKPLYDTGRLVRSINYDKKERAIKAVDYAKSHADGTLRDWNNRKIPARDFIGDTNKILNKTTSKEYFGNKNVVILMKKVREALKGTYFKKTFVR
tara:strand:+ start:91 stop:594 length:504 start_codon:yes stop_codon:yes gene_type:complete